MSANFHPLVYIIDYILGVIMWTLIGRVAMNIFQKEDSQFFFMRVFVKFTNPLLNIFYCLPRIVLPDGTRTSSTIFCVAAFGAEVIKLTTTIDIKLTADPKIPNVN